MKRRNAWAAITAAALIMATAAWLYTGEGRDEASRSAAAVNAPGADAPQAARQGSNSIPFSPSRTQAPSAGPGVPHKTAPPTELPPHAPAKSLVAAWLQQANAQPPNAEAAMNAYELLTRCRRLAADPPKEPDPNAPDCSGLSEADWKDSARLLKLAAELGNERAQLTFAQRLVGLGREPDEIAANRDELLASQEKARQYLNTLAERGNVDGMWFLGESMRTGEASEPNLMMAYAYKYAVARVGGYPYTIDAELSRLESQISPADQAKARDYADRLIERCCSKK